MQRILFAALFAVLSLVSIRFFKPAQSAIVAGAEKTSNIVAEEKTPNIATEVKTPDVVGDEKTPITIEYITGKFEPKFHPDFVQIEKKYADRDSLVLRKETYQAFKKMYAAAAKEGITLTILSATRNFNYQKGIWERKWVEFSKKTSDPKAIAQKILQFSSMPGSSRHHWGTDIDFDNLSNAYFETGKGKRTYEWMKKNAASFGFCQPYTAGRPTGYNEEKWHWTYMPLSKDFTDFAQKYLKNEQISGFKGAETAVKLDIVKNYVLGINRNCF